MRCTPGVALEHKAALMGVKVQAATKSQRASENINSSCDLRAIEAITVITKVFRIMCVMIIALTVTGICRYREMAEQLSPDL